MGFNVAIDGPAGAGKSTVAKLAAETLAFIYIDTGAMYRAIGLYVYRQGVDGDDEAAVSEAAKDAQVSISFEDGERRIYLNGEDVSAQIRREIMGTMASKVSAFPAVREQLRGLQYKMAKEYDIIMDGRDIGTCVLPDADVKIYLTADAAVRARRRCEELRARGQEPDLQQIQKDIEERDYRDMHRAVSPLRQAEDAVLLDTSAMTIEQAVREVVRLVQEKRGWK